MPHDLQREIVEAVISRLVEVRLKKLLSQDCLAELTGLSRSGIRQIESREAKAKFYSILKISTALNLKIGQLIGRSIRVE